jgi:hypothetical protein
VGDWTRMLTTCSEPDAISHGSGSTISGDKALAICRTW